MDTHRIRILEFLGSVHSCLPHLAIPSIVRISWSICVQDFQNMDVVRRRQKRHAPLCQWFTRQVWRRCSYRYVRIIWYQVMSLIPHPSGPNELSFRSAELVEPVLANKELRKGPCKYRYLLSCRHYGRQDLVHTLKYFASYCLLGGLKVFITTSVTSPRFEPWI